MSTQCVDEFCEAIKQENEGLQAFGFPGTSAESELKNALASRKFVAKKTAHRASLLRKALNRKFSVEVPRFAVPLKIRRVRNSRFLKIEGASNSDQLVCLASQEWFQDILTSFRGGGNAIFELKLSETDTLHGHYHFFLLEDRYVMTPTFSLHRTTRKTPIKLKFH